MPASELTVCPACNPVKSASANRVKLRPSATTHNPLLGLGLHWRLAQFARPKSKQGSKG